MLQMNKWKRSKERKNIRLPSTMIIRNIGSLVDLSNNKSGEHVNVSPLQKGGKG